MTRKQLSRIALALVILAAVAGAWAAGIGDFLSLAAVKERQQGLERLLADYPLLFAGGFFLAYVAATALSVPGAAIMTLTAGALFGIPLGLPIVSVASVIGATLAMLASRYLLRGWVGRRFGDRLAAVDRGIERDGAFYLLFLRLNPAVPFVLVNLGMGLTRINWLTFAAVSLIGMLPASFIYVNAGTQIAQIESTRDILSAELLLSLVLLSLFPLAARAAVGFLQRRRRYRGWTKPRRFDRNLVVIGAGSGGLVTAYVAAAAKAKVTLIERGRMGGDCLNTGCVPSKALIRSAQAAHQMRTADRFGIARADPEVDFRAVMERVRRAIGTIAPADSAERYTALGVDVRSGHATILDPWTVEVGGERLSTRAIVIAAGAEPVVPDIPGLAEAGYLTSETLWDKLAGRAAPPTRLAIIGGGPIGTELAQAFARLGSAVFLVEAGPRILPREDPEVSAFITRRLSEEGVSVLTSHAAGRCDGRVLIAVRDGEDVPISFDELIVAVGRRARLTGYGLEALGIDTRQPLALNPFLQTEFPNIFAVGDVTGGLQFTHLASHQAWSAAVNALAGGLMRFRVNNRVVPWVTYTDPEVAHVGHNEDSARAAGIAFECVRYDLDHLDRAVTEGAAHGFVKVLTPPGKDRILGATIVTHGAGEMIAEMALAMKHGLGLGKILGTVHAYPTFSEANRAVAGAWRRDHAPERLLRIAERFHRWRRG